MIENHVLHATAWSLLRLLPPRAAFRWTIRFARMLPTIDDAEEGKRIAVAVAKRGTCLSRAMTVAARLRDAEVVIGVDPRSVRPDAPSLAAHAWVEKNGVPLLLSDVGEGEIARLRVPRAR